MSRARNALDIVSTLVVTIAALTMVGFQLEDRLSSKAPASNSANRTIKTWESDNALGIRVGPSRASIVITEFMDFECPFCKRLVPRVDSLLTEFPDEIALVFQHYPLKSHRFALPAAIAAECADKQGRFVAMYKALFADQVAFGSKSWSRYAIDAGVPDLKAFDRCAALHVDSFPRIKHGLATGARTGVSGTPTVWTNGRVGHLQTDSIRTQLKRKANVRARS